jgi:hypothetical protein
MNGHHPLYGDIPAYLLVTDEGHEPLPMTPEQEEALRQELLDHAATWEQRRAQ